MDASRKRGFMILMLKFLGDENFNKTLHMLEQESGIFSNMKYFEEKVVAGEWDEVEKYVSGFTDIHDNRNSANIYFEIRKQKFLEALERQDTVKAIDILVNELEVISQYNPDMYKELTLLLNININNFKVSGLLSEYMKGLSLMNLKMFIQNNDRFAGKLSFPIIEPSSRMTTLSNQSITPKMINHVRILDNENAASNKVVGLLFTNKGSGLLALGSNGILKLWKYIQNPGEIEIRLYKPKSGLVMRNKASNVKLEEAVPCLALTKNDSYVVSAIGGEVSLFRMVTFEVLTTFMAPPPASTFFAFHPKDYNIMAIGMEDSTILIYNIKMQEVISTLRGHQKRVTGLAFSTRLNVLVSSAADAQLCEWNLDSWIKEKSVPLPLLAEKASSTSVDTRVQFHSDSSIRLLVSNENLLAIYDSSKTVLLCQWVPQGPLSAPISSAAYSCNGVIVYASFCDGYVGVFDADTLTPRCGVSLAVYASSTGLNDSVYPLVIATHTHDEYQLAIGMSDGSIQAFSINGGGGVAEWLPPTPGSWASCLDVVQRP